MKILALDVGSSSVKAAILKQGRVTGKIVRSGFDTDFSGGKAQVKPADVLKAVAAAINDLGPAARKVEMIGLTTMSPSWVAMDKKGRAITPIVTHQDRRSVEMARELEKRVGKARHLKLSGNRPFPGGISSTTWAWFVKHAPEVMKRADLCGHLTTFLHRQITHARVVDPSQASFMGMYSTLTMTGWNDELIDAAGATAHQLPQLVDADGMGGMVTRDGASQFGLAEGTPMLVGCVDTSAAMLHIGAAPGQLMNTCGSTDVLALCTDKPVPHERLLTRALGKGRMWVSVSTIASAGTTILWAKENLFAEESVGHFRARVARLANEKSESTVRFEPYLGGERTSIEQKQGAFKGLTLATTRDQMLRAIIEALAQASADRLPLLAKGKTALKSKVFISGGVKEGLSDLLQRKWKQHGKWQFAEIEEATLKGIAELVGNGK